MGKRLLAHAALFLIFAMIIYGCQKDQPVLKIGFVGNLTGDKTSALTIGARNGALLAVDDINAKGGLQGRRVKLIIKDDRLDPEVSVKVDRELIRENVAAIIGHIYSDMCVVALPIVSQSKMVLISPIAASDKLTGIDDYLFRINPPITDTSVAMAEYAFNQGIRQMAVYFEGPAVDYTKTKSDLFKKAFEALGGHAISKSFTAGEGLSYPDLAAGLVESGADGYFIIAGPLETAMICQHLRKIDTTRPIYISPWAYHQELLQNGGSAVEGVVLTHSYQRTSRDPAFLQFKENFHKRYKTMPGMWATFGYEAAMVLFQALSRNPDPGQLKATILEIGRFKGLQGDILFDRFGDNRRKPILLTVRNGAFVEIP